MCYERMTVQFNTRRPYFDAAAAQIGVVPVARAPLKGI